MRDDIDFYKAINGKKYAKEFLEEIESSHEELWIQLTGCLKHISYRENRKRPFSAPLGGGMFEARAKSGKLQGRINYFYENGMILLNGYVKSDRGSEKRGIALGRKLLKERNERKKNEKK